MQHEHRQQGVREQSSRLPLVRVCDIVFLNEFIKIYTIVFVKLQLVSLSFVLPELLVARWHVPVSQVLCVCHVRSLLLTRELKSSSVVWCCHGNRCKVATEGFCFPTSTACPPSNAELPLPYKYAWAEGFVGAGNDVSGRLAHRATLRQLPCWGPMPGPIVRWLTTLGRPALLLFCICHGPYDVCMTHIWVAVHTHAHTHPEAVPATTARHPAHTPHSAHKRSATRQNLPRLPCLPATPVSNAMRGVAGNVSRSCPQPTAL